MSQLLTPARGPSLIVPGRHAAPMAPREIVEATEKWARKSGRHVRWKWSHEMECWTINLSMPSDAPAMRSWQEGRLKQPDPPTEGIPLMEQDPDTGDWKALDIEQYGPSGIVELLERMDTWSGRGEHDSLLELVKKVIDGNREKRRKHRAQMKQHVLDRAKSLRRTRLEIPFLGVGIDIGNGDESQ